VVLLRVAMDAGVSTFDAALTLYGSDDATVTETADRRGAGGVEELRFVCAEDGWRRAMVAASPNANGLDRTGGFTFTAAALESIKAKPVVVRLFPGRAKTLSVVGRFGPLVPDAAIDLVSLTGFESFDPFVADVSAQGLVTAGEADDARTTILVVPTDPGVAALAVPVEVSSLVPGEIFVSDEVFPQAIPDSYRNGLTSVIAVPDQAVLREVYVGVSITHPDIRHLVVDLVSPWGATVRLHKGAIAGANLVTIYGALVEPDGPGALADLAGRPAAGEWKLVTIDDDRLNSGRLNAWRLYLVFE